MYMMIFCIYFNYTRAIWNLSINNSNYNYNNNNNAIKYCHSTPCNYGYMYIILQKIYILPDDNTYSLSSQDR